MRVSTSRALTLLNRSYRNLPLSDRAHIIGRFATCPFLRVLPHIPANADILDIGAGHGIFAALALETGVRSLVALEPDLRKVILSRTSVPVRWVAGFDPAVRGAFDVVTMFDVLYRIPLEERNALFARIFERVRPGGRILIKELDPARSLKFAWNRTQEWLSDRFLGLTLGDAFAYEPADAVAGRLALAGFEDFRIERIDAWYPHSHVLYIARRSP